MSRLYAANCMATGQRTQPTQRVCSFFAGNPTAASLLTIASPDGERDINILAIVSA
ncbi:MAG TPA: hypothetical protein VFN53_08125 [Acidobacteriaceae bacterium]|nr:hypothetical protein [Acidobacteriaceae bacterium]